MDNNDELTQGRGYKHIHMHDHDLDFGAVEVPPAIMKDLVLLEYLLDHNKQHAHELSDIGVRLKGEGFASAAEMVSDAVRSFQQANNQLQTAVTLIKGPVEYTE